MWWFFATCSTIGSTCGGCLGYGMGHFWGRPLFEKIIHKKTVEMIEKSYRACGMWAVAIAGFTPVPYKVFAICSGFFEINLLQFALVSFVSRGARFFLVSGLLYFIGPHIKDQIIASVNVFSFACIGSILIVYIAYKLFKKKQVHHG
jgi:undecaprenyl-diphosphatase